MGFYIRKAVKAGPFRFNLSKSGIGVSTGVPGFRVGSGPRGNYVHMGRHGVYYRTAYHGTPLLGGSRAHRTVQHPAQFHTPHAPAYRPNDVILEGVTGATAMSLEPTGGGDVVEQLNTVATRMRWGWPVTIASLVLGLVYPPYSLIVWVLLAPLCWWVFLHDQASRTVVLFYDVNDSHAAWFDSLVTQWDWLTGSQRLWRITQAGVVRTTRQYKSNSGVGRIVDRISVAASTDGPNNLSTNVAIPSLVARNSGLYFLPDRLLVKEGRRYSDVAYQYLKVSSAQTHFHESPSSVPGDALQVGQTWQYVNVKGGPDHRYKNNPTLPIMLYGLLEITSPQGLSWLVQTSRADAAPAIASVLSKVPAIRHK
ncbi:MAG: DUF4236 domain-containing protein [Mycobacterium sp.]